MGHYMDKMRNAHEIMVIKSEAKRPFGKIRHRWKNVITFYIIKIECAKMQIGYYRIRSQSSLLLLILLLWFSCQCEHHDKSLGYIKAR
jgi:hypothetical protein